MSRRWFVSTVSIGAAGGARSVTDARPTFSPRVRVRRTVKDQPSQEPATFAGPQLQLLGPGDCVGLERSLIVREEPHAGSRDGMANNLAQIEFSDASLPWLLSLPGRGRLPWIALLVLREDEGDLHPGVPPFIVAPPAALPDLAESASWAHAEARVDSAGPPAQAISQDVRSNLDNVVSRLICPRVLTADSGWLACVVPTTKAGVIAGLDPTAPTPADGHAPAWAPGQAGGVRLPVYHAWRFRTGQHGSFEDLARRLTPVKKDELRPGFGSRTISVRHPWPHTDVLAGAPETVTVDVQGALRLPGSETPAEAWSDHDAMHTFQDTLRGQLNAPATRRTRIGAEPDRDDKAVAPPLYGSHHTGVQQVPEDGTWMEMLNTQVQFRVAAALGARYVQLEQEFLMARAWEQVGAVNEANRMLAAAELATEAAQSAQTKHVVPMAAAALTELADVMRADVRVAGAGPLQTVLHQSAVPDGAASTAFHRLTRRGGALDRRSRRAAAVTDMPAGSVLTAGLAGTETVPSQTPLWLAALDGVEEGPLAPARVRRDPSATFATQTLLSLLGGQETSFLSRSPFVSGAVADKLNTFTQRATQSMSSTTLVAERPLPRPVVLRGLRRLIVKEDPRTFSPATFSMTMGVETVATDVRAAIVPMNQQLDRMKAKLIAAAVDGQAVAQPEPAPTMAPRADFDARPLRPIMAHPVFGFPIAAELLTRWPEWAVPGITTFPEDSTTLLETNSAFVEALLVGLNQEFNRELRWREYPTDEAGTPFSRFWPAGNSDAQFGEIARWDPAVALGEHDPDRGRDLLVLLVRGEVLRRYPGTVVLAAKSVDGRVPPAPPAGEWKDPRFVLPVDDHTNLYCFDLTAPEARAGRWMFVVREPSRGTQFGFDVETAPSPAFETWADLHWGLVPTKNGFVCRRGGDKPAPVPSTPPPPDFPTWAESSPANFARVLFQQPFQLAFSPNKMLPQD